MADFAVWAVACEKALGFEPGSFMARYNEIRKDANELALDTSPLPPVLRVFAKAQGGLWQGSASELLDALNAHLQAVGDDRTPKARDWPKRADKLSGTLRRYAPNLRATGLKVEFERTSKQRSVLLRLAAGGVTGVTGVSGDDEQRGARAHEGDARYNAKTEGGVTSGETAESAFTPDDDARDAADAKGHDAPKWEVEL